VCRLTGEEEGIALLLLPPESQGCGDGFASLHGEVGEKSKDGVNMPFLLLVRACSSAGLRRGTHPHVRVARCKHRHS